MLAMVDHEIVFLPLNTRVVSAIISAPAIAIYQLLLRQYGLGEASVDGVPGLCSVVFMEWNELIYVRVKI
jgi:hypothetical protein